MNNLIKFFSNDISQAIGWTIIHSIWQSCLVALLVVISYAFTKRSNANTRYWITAAGLTSCIAVSLTTFIINLNETITHSVMSSTVFYDSVLVAQIAQKHTLADVIDAHLDKVVFLWLLGFSFYFIKYATAIFYCQHLKNHRNNRQDEQWTSRFNELKNSLGITKPVNLRISELITIPCVIGHFKPLVLIPASIILGLPSKQIEMVLLHELGHVRRNDYFVNSLQMFVKSIYFFNPFIYWISSKIDEERENACDDVAVSLCGEPMLYANTLKAFAEIENQHSLGVAMKGSKNLLLNRIKRMFSKETSFPKMYGKSLTIMALFLFITSYSATGFSDIEKNKDEHNFSVEKVPLSEAFALAEQYCPNQMSELKLSNPYRIVSADFKNVSCEKLAKFILRTDKVFKEKTFKSDFMNESIDTILSKLSENCPGISERVAIKRPSQLNINFISDSATCGLAQSYIESQYLAATIPADESTIVNDGFGTAPYSAAIWPNMEAPERLKVNADVNCNSGFSVDKKGKSFDVASRCTSNNQEAASAFEKALVTAISKTQFKPKIVNGKLLTITNIRLSNNFLVDEKYGVL